MIGSRALRQCTLFTVTFHCCGIIVGRACEYFSIRTEKRNKPISQIHSEQLSNIRTSPNVLLRYRTCQMLNEPGELIKYTYAIIIFHCVFGRHRNVWLNRCKAREFFIDETFARQETNPFRDD